MNVRDAEVTVVGGGAIGCSVLYHLAEAGFPDVQLIEAGQLAGATSGQAAGLVGQVRTSVERTRLAMASVDLFSRLQRDSPWPIDWRQTGSVRIATTEERVAEFDRMMAVGRSVGLEVELLDATELAAPGPHARGPDRSGRAVVPHRRLPPAQQPHHGVRAGGTARVERPSPPEPACST